jgi:hypothetical protein
VVLALSVWCAAAPGAAMLGACVLPTAMGLPLIVVTAFGGSGWPRTFSPLTFVLLPFVFYLLFARAAGGGMGAKPPLSFFNGFIFSGFSRISGRTMSKDKTPQAVQRCHELMVWMIPQLDKMPRQRRFTLGDKLELILLDVLESLVTAAYSKDKQRMLQHANNKLEVVRHLWRMAMELKAVSLKSWTYGAQLMVDLGRQVGGWSKSVQARQSTA